MDLYLSSKSMTVIIVLIMVRQGYYIITTILSGINTNFTTMTTMGLHYWPLVRGITGYQWITLTKGQWCRPLIFVLPFTWTSCWTNSCYQWLYTPLCSCDVTVMIANQYWLLPSRVPYMDTQLPVPSQLGCNQLGASITEHAEVNSNKIPC